MGQVVWKPPYDDSIETRVDPSRKYDAIIAFGNRVRHGLLHGNTGNEWSPSNILKCVRSSDIAGFREMNMHALAETHAHVDIPRGKATSLYQVLQCDQFGNDNNRRKVELMDSITTPITIAYHFIQTWRLITISVVTC